MGNLLLSVICLFVSPLAVYLKRGIGNDFWINLILYVIGVWCLGTIHGFWVILRKEP